MIALYPAITVRAVDRENVMRSQKEDRIEILSTEMMHAKGVVLRMDRTDVTTNILGRENSPYQYATFHFYTTKI